MVKRKSKRMKWGLLIPAVLLAAGVPYHFLSRPEGPRKKVEFDRKNYFVLRMVALTRDRDGFDGKMELLFDKKLEKEKSYEAMQAVMNAQEEEEHQREREGKEEDEDEFAMATLCLSDIGGNAVDVHPLEHAVALMKNRIDPYGDGTPVYPVEVKYKAGAIDRTETLLAEVRGGRLVLLPLPALYDENDAHLRLANRWQWAPARSGKGADILVFNVAQVGGEGQPLQSIYTRYFFDGHQWAQKNKVVKAGAQGTWESLSGRFPDPSLFP